MFEETGGPAAILAGWGIGVYATLEEGVERLRPSLQRLDPNPSFKDLYEERLKEYQRASRLLNTTGSGRSQEGNHEGL